MNGKKVKMIAKVASKLPESVNFRKVRRTKRGVDITDDELKRIGKKQKDIDPKGFYQIIENEVFIIDHKEELKRAYKKNREQGMVDYCSWLKWHNREMFAKYGKGDPNEWQFTNEWLDKIIEGGPTRIWNVFEMFLASFLAIFGKDLQEIPEHIKKGQKFPEKFN